jgi:hypothetical protein
MTRIKVSTAHCAFCATVALLLSGVLFAPVRIEAQQGNNAVWGAGSTPAGSAAYIDASAFASTSTDLCATLYSIISSTSYPPSGAVIDARGINASNSANDGNGNMKCVGTPWVNGTGNTTNPATILLPPGYTIGCMGCTGSGNILIYQTWTLPNGSKIIGQGPNPGANATLQAASSFSGTAMIVMGSSSSPFACPLVSSTYVCTGISVEHITLEASNMSIDGIDNNYSQAGSYVTDVSFSDVGGTGLSVSAPNSGPYSDLNYSAAQPSSAGSVCAELQAQTRGIHGITCIGNSNVASGANSAAIYVNASNNSIEDAHVESFTDGVRIGDTTTAVGNVVVSNLSMTNRSNMGGNTYGYMLNTVHICGPNTNAIFMACSNTNPITQDVSIYQASDFSTGHLSTVIQDDMTGTSIPPQNGSPSVATYVLGEGAQIGTGNPQYSRFGTSPSVFSSSCTTSSCSTAVPTWLTGDGSSAGGQTCTLPGSLYSNTGGSYAIYVCTWVSGALKWAGLI